MASDVLRDIFVRIGVKTDDAALKKFDKSVDRAKAGLFDMAKGAAILGGSFWAAKKFTDSIAEIGDAAEETASKVGVTVAELQTLQKLGELSGIAADNTALSLKFLARTAYEAATGAKEAGEMFAAIGVSVTDASGKLKSNYEITGEVADRFQKMENGAKKTRIALGLFGRSGHDMIPMLNQGAEGIAAMRQELSDMGILLSDEDAKAMSQFRDDSQKMEWAMKGVAITIGKILMPMMRDLFLWIRAKMKPAMEWLQKNTGLVKVAFKALAVAIAAMGIGFMIAGIVKLAMAVGGLAAALGAMGTAGLIAFGKMIAIPLIIGAGIAALVLMAQDLWLTLTNPEAMTVFREFWTNIKADIQSAIDLIKEFFGISQKPAGPAAGTPERAAFRENRIEANTFAVPQIPGGLPSSVAVSIGSINIDAQGADSKELSTNIVQQVTEQVNAARRGLAGM